MLTTVPSAPQAFQNGSQWASCQRYVVSELAGDLKLGFLANRWTATTFAVVTAAGLAFATGANGQGAIKLWPLFGTTNQLTAGLSLLVLTLFLVSLKRRIWVTVVPMAFLLVMTTWAMVLNLITYWTESQALLLGVGGAIFVLELWLMFEGMLVVRRVLAGRTS